MSLRQAPRKRARQAEGKTRGEPVGNDGTARGCPQPVCCGQRRCPPAGAGCQTGENPLERKKYLTDDLRA